MSGLVTGQNPPSRVCKRLLIGRAIWKRPISLVCLYLTAIVLANLSVAHFGPGASIITAFILIGLDLSSRDSLHELWQGRGFVWKMGALIATGSILSYALNQGAGRIALASLLAFGLSAAVDTISYQLMHHYPKLVKMNGSNVFSGAVDSLIFPTIAFGSFLPLIVLGQFAAKFAGGAVWSLILTTRKAKAQP